MVVGVDPTPPSLVGATWALPAVVPRAAAALATGPEPDRAPDERGQAGSRCHDGHDPAGAHAPPLRRVDRRPGQCRQPPRPRWARRRHGAPPTPPRSPLPGHPDANRTVAATGGTTGTDVPGDRCGPRAPPSDELVTGDPSPGWRSGSRRTGVIWDTRHVPLESRRWVPELTECTDRPGASARGRTGRWDRTGQRVPVRRPLPHGPAPPADPAGRRDDRRCIGTDRER